MKCRLLTGHRGARWELETIKRPTLQCVTGSTIASCAHPHFYQKQTDLFCSLIGDTPGSARGPCGSGDGTQGTGLNLLNFSTCELVPLTKVGWTQTGDEEMPGWSPLKDKGLDSA